MVCCYCWLEDMELLLIHIRLTTRGRSWTCPVSLLLLLLIPSLLVAAAPLKLNCVAW